jgi:hypothetical protein
MNPQQQVFWDQAKTDYDIFLFLKDQPACHRLHYLQMCMEKLAKAYFFGRKKPPDLVSHAILLRFLRTIANQKVVCKSLASHRRQDVRKQIMDLLPLAYDLERLAPALAGDGPNPEYPWPRERPTIAPIHYQFPLWHTLQKTAPGRKFQALIGRLLEKFPDWA